MQFEWPIAGHENLILNLQNIILNNKLSHAYIFSGPSNIGKTIVVQYFIQSILCQNKTVRPCRQCLHCLQIERNIHPDIFRVKKEEDKKNIAVEQIRGLQEKLNKGSLLNSFKIAVIEQAELLTIEASNSLLKTLEEPSLKTIIILITAKLNSLPNTIKSRCQIYKLLPLSGKKIYDHLITLGVKRKQALEISGLVSGKIGSAIQYADNLEELKNYQKELKTFLKMFNSEIFKRIEYFDDFKNQKEVDPKIQIKKYLDILTQLIRDLMLVKTECSDFLSCSFVQNDLAETARVISLQKLLALHNQILTSVKSLELNINPKLLLENLIIQL